MLINYNKAFRVPYSHQVLKIHDPTETKALHGSRAACTSQC